MRVNKIRYWCARVGTLDRLLPLVRFPMMASIEPMMAEPLFMRHPLGMQVAFECVSSFAASAAAAGCRRLRAPWKGRLSGGGIVPNLDWMDTTDGFGGFQKLDHFPNVALAVSKADMLEVRKVYDAPAGWHWGAGRRWRRSWAAERRRGTSDRVPDGDALDSYYVFESPGEHVCSL